MPRQSTQFGTDSVGLRQFLRAVFESPADLLRVALDDGDDVAQDLFVFVLMLRANQRSRHHLGAVREAWHRVTAPGWTGGWPRWLSDLAMSAHAMYRTMRVST